MLRTFLLFFAFASFASPQSGLMAISSVADVTGTGVAVQMVSAGGPARWIQLIALAANSAAVRCGDSNVSATRGAAIAAGGGMMLPPIPISGDVSKQPQYNLAKLYCYIANNDKVSVLWAN